MTKENQAKWERACEALKLMGLEPTDFVDLDMAMCLKTWADDLELGPMSVDEVIDIHNEVGYLKDVVARALVL